MKKIILEFWYCFFYLGSFLNQLGDWMEGKGIDELEELIRDDPILYQDQKKRGRVL